MEHIHRSPKRQFVEKRLIFVSTISRSKMERAKHLVKMMKFHGSKIFECEYRIYIPLRLPMKEWNQGRTKLSEGQLFTFRDR